jgi:hypothetical protein
MGIESVELSTEDGMKPLQSACSICYSYTCPRRNRAQNGWLTEHLIAIDRDAFTS